MISLGDILCDIAESTIETIFSKMPGTFMPVIICMAVLVAVIVLILFLMFRHLRKTQEIMLAQVREAYEGAMNAQQKTIDQLLQNHMDTGRSNQRNNRNQR